MGDHEVCITRRKEEEEEEDRGREGGRTASEVRDWHPTLILPVFTVSHWDAATMEMSLQEITSCWLYSDWCHSLNRVSTFFSLSLSWHLGILRSSLALTLLAGGGVRGGGGIVLLAASFTKPFSVKLTLERDKESKQINPTFCHACHPDQ